MMTDNFCIIKVGEGYFMQLHDTGCTKDGIIAKELGLTIKEYRKILKHDFNGQQDPPFDNETPIIPDTYFKSLEDVRKAVNWANAMLMMKRLRKSKKV